jgi:hypothetical protein
MILEKKNDRKCSATRYESREKILTKSFLVLVNNLGKAFFSSRLDLSRNIILHEFAFPSVLRNNIVCLGKKRSIWILKTGSKQVRNDWEVAILEFKIKNNWIYTIKRSINGMDPNFP